VPAVDRQRAEAGVRGKREVYGEKREMKERGRESTGRKKKR